jgi:hypothetical protein
MNAIENEVLAVAQEVDPAAPIVQAAEAVVATVADPSALTIVSDLEAAHSIIADFKAKMAGLHPTVANLFKALF